ncbi:DUF177 domain-containing protein [Antrihabitans sp. YC3-6]|uniref:DUF177 domain-containing protein n=1 Tax=Antrihabitans stalagmiti TaxID=2799499 RepID=A0A934NVV1_9NOCA|nr:DUF177 domain-containing protein [Antrihabitans stalagmiti]MBJ8342235.1 DUF177 domain-containing protein [Antrihabitans stalagmiti]
MSARTGSQRRRLTDADFVLDTRTLGRRAGSMREVTRTVVTPVRIGLDLIAIEEGAEVDLNLRLEAVSEGVLITGTLGADLVGECSRCLEPFDDEIQLHLTELFAYPDSTTERTTEEDEIYRVVDDHVDLEPVVIDAVGLALPLQPLCTPDCQGLCSECGVRLAIAGSDHGHEILDPRWAGLAAKQVQGAGSASNQTVKQEAEEI